MWLEQLAQHDVIGRMAWMAANTLLPELFQCRRAALFPTPALASLKASTLGDPTCAGRSKATKQQPKIRRTALTARSIPRLHLPAAQRRRDCRAVPAAAERRRRTGRTQ